MIRSAKLSNNQIPLFGDKIHLTGLNFNTSYDDVMVPLPNNALWTVTSSDVTIVPDSKLKLVFDQGVIGEYSIESVQGFDPVNGFGFRLHYSIEGLLTPNEGTVFRFDINSSDGDQLRVLLFKDSGTNELVLSYGDHLGLVSTVVNGTSGFVDIYFDGDSAWFGFKTAVDNLLTQKQAWSYTGTCTIEISSSSDEDIGFVSFWGFHSFPVLKGVYDLSLDSIWRFNSKKFL